MSIDLRPVLVLLPVILVIGWAAFNIGKDVIAGKTQLFGSRGNNPFQ